MTNQQFASYLWRNHNRPLLIEGKTPWEFACAWYGPDEVERCINSNNPFMRHTLPEIPSDIHSREFAEWLTEQYRLAMAKGIQIGLGARASA